MDNLFDGLQATVFSIVTDTMGFNAVWQPSEGGPPVSGRVLFNDPSQKQQVGDMRYLPANCEMEYPVSLFVGLKPAVDKALLERVTIKGVTYNVSQVKQKYDGNTFLAVLIPIE